MINSIHISSVNDAVHACLQQDRDNIQSQSNSATFVPQKCFKLYCWRWPSIRESLKHVLLTSNYITITSSPLSTSEESLLNQKSAGPLTCKWWHKEQFYSAANDSPPHISKPFTMYKGKVRGVAETFPTCLTGWALFHFLIFAKSAPSWTKQPARLTPSAQLSPSSLVRSNHHPQNTQHGLLTPAPKPIICKHVWFEPIATSLLCCLPPWFGNALPILHWTCFLDLINQ